ncbi:DUF6461 domain-containing protein [Streptosporangium sp. NPDC002721]|uniref:DUF6461 domain-containing protein n=1 Tax=Streptosporangium sp. NPDC002721 TaxID=3366188 RepID=UPI0036B7AF87
MITPPGDHAWFSDSGFAESYSLIFVRGLTPEQLVARTGDRAEDLSWTTLDAGARHDHEPGSGGVTTVGDWAFTTHYYSWFGADDEFLVPLSAGTRLVSLSRLDIKGLEDFRWVEDGEIRFGFWAQEGYSEEVPDELAETMRQIDHDYGEDKYELYRGPGLVLIERLTGIRLTPRILDGSA